MLSSVFMVKNVFKIALIWYLGSALHGVGVCKLKLLSMILKIYFKKKMLAYELIRDMRGYLIQVCLSSNLSIEKC